MKDSTILIALSIAATAGIALAFMLKPSIRAGDYASIGNVIYNVPASQPPQVPQQTLRRLPHINNGDNTNMQTSYTPGGY